MKTMINLFKSQNDLTKAWLIFTFACALMAILNWQMALGFYTAVMAFAGILAAFLAALNGDWG